MKPPLYAVISAVVLSSLSFSLHAQELVTNGTFDTDLSGWTIISDDEFEWVDIGASWLPLQDGILSADEVEGFSISQAISDLIPGQEYVFSFSIALEEWESKPASLVVSLLDTASTTHLFTPFLFNDVTWPEEEPAIDAQTFSTRFIADGPAASLSFITSGYAEGLLLDNISITPVPEPSGLMLVGAAGLLGLHRRRRTHR